MRPFVGLGNDGSTHSYLPAYIIPTLYYYGYQLNSQIFLTIYFWARFFLRQEILHQHFLRHKILHIYFGVCVVSLLSKINVQIFVTQTIVMQKILMQKMMLQK